MPNINFV